MLRCLCAVTCGALAGVAALAAAVFVISECFDTRLWEI